MLPAVVVYFLGANPTWLLKEWAVRFLDPIHFVRSIVN